MRADGGNKRPFTFLFRAHRRPAEHTLPFAPASARAASEERRGAR